MASTGTTLVEVEEQLQQVMVGLERFRRAAESLENGRRTLEETAVQVKGLVDQAGASLKPAVDAVATLKKLDPDLLLGQVVEAAASVSEQLGQVTQTVNSVQAEFDRVTATVASMQGRVEELQRATGDLAVRTGRIQEALGVHRTFIMAALGLLGLNTLLLFVVVLR